VTLLDQAAQVLPQEDADAAAIVARRLTADGVRLLLGAPIRGASPAGVDVAGAGLQPCDRILVAVGRAPNVEALDLPAAGVASGSAGIVVDDHLRTTNRRIFAAGDVCSRFQFTHAADALARIVVRNALFFGRARASALVIPWCTYTDPEVAHVGVYEAEAARAGRRVETITIPLADVDRAIVDEPGRFVRVHHERGRLAAPSSHRAPARWRRAHALTHGAGLAAGATISSRLNNASRRATPTPPR
jgi:pyruvate/2-oxoglutarate dehydrogenase complex dihydrolipoamide dehydrogenase (E3) component